MFNHNFHAEANYKSSRQQSHPYRLDSQPKLFGAKVKSYKDSNIPHFRQQNRPSLALSCDLNSVSSPDVAKTISFDPASYFVLPTNSLEPQHCLSKIALSLDQRLKLASNILLYQPAPALPQHMLFSIPDKTGIKLELTSNILEDDHVLSSQSHCVLPFKTAGHFVGALAFVEQPAMHSCLSALSLPIPLSEYQSQLQLTLKLHYHPNLQGTCSPASYNDSVFNMSLNHYLTGIHKVADVHSSSAANSNSLDAILSYFVDNFGPEPEVVAINLNANNNTSDTQQHEPKQCKVDDGQRIDGGHGVDGGKCGIDAQISTDRAELSPADTNQGAIGLEQGALDAAMVSILVEIEPDAAKPKLQDHAASSCQVTDLLNYAVTIYDDATNYVDSTVGCVANHSSKAFPTNWLQPDSQMIGIDVVNVDGEKTLERTYIRKLVAYNPQAQSIHTEIDLTSPEITLAQARPCSEISLKIAKRLNQVSAHTSLLNKSLNDGLQHSTAPNPQQTPATINAADLKVSSIGTAFSSTSSQLEAQRQVPYVHQSQNHQVQLRPSSSYGLQHHATSRSSPQRRTQISLQPQQAQKSGSASGLLGCQIPQAYQRPAHSAERDQTGGQNLPDRVSLEPLSCDVHARDNSVQHQHSNSTSGNSDLHDSPIVHYDLKTSANRQDCLNASNRAELAKRASALTNLMQQVFAVISNSGDAHETTNNLTLTPHTQDSPSSIFWAVHSKSNQDSGYFESDVKISANRAAPSVTCFESLMLQELNKIAFNDANLHLLSAFNPLEQAAYGLVIACSQDLSSMLPAHLVDPQSQEDSMDDNDYDLYEGSFRDEDDEVCLIDTSPAVYDDEVKYDDDDYYSPEEDEDYYDYQQSIDYTACDNDSLYDSLYDDDSPTNSSNPTSNMPVPNSAVSTDNSEASNAESRDESTLDQSSLAALSSSEVWDDNDNENSIGSNSVNSASSLECATNDLDSDIDKIAQGQDNFGETSGIDQDADQISTSAVFSSNFKQNSNFFPSPVEECPYQSCLILDDVPDQDSLVEDKFQQDRAAPLTPPSMQPSTDTNHQAVENDSHTSKAEEAMATEESMAAEADNALAQDESAHTPAHTKASSSLPESQAQDEQAQTAPETNYPHKSSYVGHLGIAAIFTQGLNTPSFNQEQDVAHTPSQQADFSRDRLSSVVPLPRTNVSADALDRGNGISLDVLKNQQPQAQSSDSNHLNGNVNRAAMLSSLASTTANTPDTAADGTTRIADVNDGVADSQFDEHDARSNSDSVIIDASTYEPSQVSTQEMIAALVPSACYSFNHNRAMAQNKKSSKPILKSQLAHQGRKQQVAPAKAAPTKVALAQVAPQQNLAAKGRIKAVSSSQLDAASKALDLTAAQVEDSLPNNLKVRPLPSYAAEKQQAFAVSLDFDKQDEYLVEHSPEYQQLNLRQLTRSELKHITQPNKQLLNIYYRITPCILRGSTSSQPQSFGSLPQIEFHDQFAAQTEDTHSRTSTKLSPHLRHDPKGQPSSNALVEQSQLGLIHPVLGRIKELPTQPLEMTIPSNSAHGSFDLNEVPIPLHQLKLDPTKPSNIFDRICFYESKWATNLPLNNQIENQSSLDICIQQESPYSCPVHLFDEPESSQLCGQYLGNHDFIPNSTIKLLPSREEELQKQQELLSKLQPQNAPSYHLARSHDFTEDLSDQEIQSILVPEQDTNPTLMLDTSCEPPQIVKIFQDDDGSAAYSSVPEQKAPAYQACPTQRYAGVTMKSILQKELAKEARAHKRGEYGFKPHAHTSDWELEIGRSRHINYKPLKDEIEIDNCYINVEDKPTPKIAATDQAKLGSNTSEQPSLAEHQSSCLTDHATSSKTTTTLLAPRHSKTTQQAALLGTASSASALSAYQIQHDLRSVELYPENSDHLSLDCPPPDRTLPAKGKHKVTLKITKRHARPKNKAKAGSKSINKAADTEPHPAASLDSHSKEASYPQQDGAALELIGTELNSHTCLKLSQEFSVTVKDVAPKSTNMAFQSDTWAKPEINEPKNATASTVSTVMPKVAEATDLTRRAVVIDSPDTEDAFASQLESFLATQINIEPELDLPCTNAALDVSSNEVFKISTYHLLSANSLDETAQPSHSIPSEQNRKSQMALAPQNSAPQSYPDKRQAQSNQLSLQKQHAKDSQSCDQQASEPNSNDHTQEVDTPLDSTKSMVNKIDDVAADEAPQPCSKTQLLKQNLVNALSHLTSRLRNHQPPVLPKNQALLAGSNNGEVLPLNQDTSHGLTVVEQENIKPAVTNMNSNNQGTLPSTSLLKHRSLQDLNALMGAHRQNLILNALQGRLMQIVFGLGGLAIAVFSLGALIYQSNSNSNTPYVVTVDSHGVVVGNGTANVMGDVPKEMIIAQLCDFIRNIRVFTNDPVIQRQSIIKAFSYVTPGSAVSQQLTDYYKFNNPFDHKDTMSISIDIANAIETSNQTFQIDWLEISTDKKRPRRMRAQIGYRLMPTEEVQEKGLLLNPLGLTIESLIISKIMDE